MYKLTIVLILFTSLVFAGDIKTGEPIEITEGAGQEFYYPLFSPSGEEILLTTSNYSGLWIMNLETRQITKITENGGAGYAPSITEDGKSIVYRKNEFLKRKKYSSIIVFNRDEKTEQVIAGPSRELSVPAILENENICYMESGKSYSFELEKRMTGELKSADNPALFFKYPSLIFMDGDETYLSPFGEGTYIWSSLSPDKSLILSNYMGKTTFICDPQGNIITEFGRANAPVWSPDGSKILFMDDKDDGHKITGSELVVINTDGSGRQNITNTPDRVEMYPQWSPDGSKIIYNTTKGKIYLMNIIRD